MGLTRQTLEFFLEGLAQRPIPHRILTLGKQGLWVAPERIVQLLRQHQLLHSQISDQTAIHRLAIAPWRLKAMLQLIGVEQVEACDVSDYEGAERIHDLNQPIPEDWHGRYDLVLDGGTLEHIFDIRRALENVMALVRVGGRVFLFTPTNNYCGHGFYQFSPELFWRVFSPENGFRILRMHIAVDTEGYGSFFGIPYPFPIRSRRYTVADPAQVGERVLLVNHRPTLLFVEAEKERETPPFTRLPQQSDYLPQWQQKKAEHPLTATGTVARWVEILRKQFSERWLRETFPRLCGILDPFRTVRFYRKFSFRNRRWYQPVRNKQK